MPNPRSGTGTPRTLVLLGALALLAACSQRAPSETAPVQEEAAVPPAPTAPAPDPAPADTARLEADYLGRWTGVEGMYLVVASKPGGGVTLDMQWDLDHRGVFDGSVTAEGLRFVRNGVAETAVHTDGAATGLKHLAGRQDCLTVNPGEGYCRE